MNSTYKLLLIVNPISGGIDKKELIVYIKKQVEDKGIPLKIYKTSGNNDADNIQNLVKRFKPKKILLAGGDGTIKLGIENAMQNDVVFGLLPVGSANGLATSLGIPSDPKKAFQLAMNKSPRPIDILQINNEIGIHISDIGMNAELIKHYEGGSYRGKLGYVLQTIPTLKNSEAPYDFTITTSEGKIHRRAMMIAIANAKMYGNGAVINPTGNIDDGKFELLIFKSIHLAKILQTILDKAPMDNSFVEVISTSKATIVSNNRVSFQIDGEYCGKLDNITVSLMPQQIKICY